MATRIWIGLGVLVAVGAILVAGGGTPSRAEDGAARHIVYLSVTGEGPNAKGWYRGAPPAGVPIQEALDRFSEQGYRVAGFRSGERSIVAVTGQAQEILDGPGSRNEYVILLEK